MATPPSVGSKPHLTVGTLGHHRHGKTTLTAAITRLLARRHPAAPGNRARSIADLTPGRTRAAGDTATYESRWIEYETAQRHYAHADCPGLRRRITATAASAAQFDAAVLVVAAPDAVMPQTREHVLYARQAGAGRLVVFLNKCDLVADPPWLDEVERDVRRVLVEYGFPGDEVPVVRGAALPAYEGDAAWEPPLAALLDALDADVVMPSRDLDEPCIFSIEHVYGREGGVVAAGRVERGVLRPGRMHLVGGAVEPVTATVLELEVFSRAAFEARAGDIAGALVKGLGTREVRRGMVLATPGAATAGLAFTARVRVLTADQGGRHTVLRSGHRAHFYLGTMDVTGFVQLPEDVGSMAPGDELDGVRIEVIEPTWVVPGMPFTFRDGSDGLEWKRGTSRQWTGTRWLRTPEPLWSGTAGMGVVTRVG